jgi:hypothetical protein
MMASLVNVGSILDDLLLVIRVGAEQVGPPNQILAAIVGTVGTGFGSAWLRGGSSIGPMLIGAIVQYVFAAADLGLEPEMRTSAQRSGSEPRTDQCGDCCAWWPSQARARKVGVAFTPPLRRGCCSGFPSSCVGRRPSLSRPPD